MDFPIHLESLFLSRFNPKEKKKQEQVNSIPISPMAEINNRDELASSSTPEINLRDEASIAENLRVEALKFIRHIQATESRTHFVPTAQGLNVPVAQEMTMAERFVFTEAVRALYPPEKDPHSTLDELLHAMYQVDDEDIQKPEAYAKVCILLIGHADLFYRFERFLNDTEVADWRRQVRGKLLGEIDALVSLCNSTIETITEEPRNLTAIQLDCIERLFLSQIVDPVIYYGAQSVDEVVARLKMEPDRYRHYALPTLRAKLGKLKEMYGFVSEYFAGVMTRAGVPP